MPRETVSKSERRGDDGGGKNYKISHKNKKKWQEYENEDILSSFLWFFWDQSRVELVLPFKKRSGEKGVKIQLKPDNGLSCFMN